MKNSTKEGYIDFFTWLTINGIFPILLPLFLSVLCSYVFLGNADLGFLSSILFSKGIYLFVGITILLSLYQDYHDTKSVFSLVIHGFFSLMILSTGMLFTTSMDFIPTDRTLADNTILHLGTLIVSILFAVYVKVKIIRYKIKKLRYGIK